MTNQHTHPPKSEESWKELDALVEQATTHLENVRTLGSRRLWNPTAVNVELLDRCAYGLTQVISRIADEEEGEDSA